jgi:D-alanyl-D-alanine carboxypeptidase (penicillin-binding protein 5/6)
MAIGPLHDLVDARPRWGRRFLGLLFVALLVAIAFVVVQLVRAEPRVTVSSLLPASVRVDGRPPRLPWPPRGSAAVEVVGDGPLASVRGDRVTPLASLAKLVTALVVLEDHPLGRDASGPAITVRASDVASYRAGLDSHQSVVRVRAGERLDEGQALEGMLVGSANNLAVLLARWDAGGTAAFVARMNALARRLGLDHTRFVDPSGLAPGDRGTAIDMTRLGVDALANPTIASIVALGEVILPVAGVAINYDYAVGHDGIVGIKTGSSSAAGGNFLFAARRTLYGRRVTVIGAVLKQEGGRSDLEAALGRGKRLAAGVLASVRPLTVLRAGTVAVRMRAPWSPSPVLGRTTAAIRVFGTPGGRATLRTVLSPTITHASRITRGARLATVTVRFGGRSYAVPVVASAGVASPSLEYRLTRLG